MGDQTSKLDVRSFCEKRGVDGRSLQYWRVKLGRDEGVAPPPEVRLVELVPQAAPVSVYRVVGVIAIEVEDTFRDETPVRILELVAGC